MRMPVQPFPVMTLPDTSNMRRSCVTKHSDSSLQVSTTHDTCNAGASQLPSTVAQVLHACNGVVIEQRDATSIGSVHNICTCAIETSQNEQASRDVPLHVGRFISPVEELYAKHEAVFDLLSSNVHQADMFTVNGWSPGMIQANNLQCNASPAAISAVLEAMITAYEDAVCLAAPAVVSVHNIAATAASSSHGSHMNARQVWHLLKMYWLAVKCRHASCGSKAFSLVIAQRAYARRLDCLGAASELFRLAAWL
jgi:hypothetical protein